MNLIAFQKKNRSAWHLWCFAILIGFVSIGTLATPALAILITETSSSLMCPVLPDEQVDPDIFVSFEGRQVFLCCEGCRRNFLADPASYREGLASVMPVASVDNHDGSGKVDHDHGSDHGSDHATPGFFRRLIQWLGKFHPAAVHFPIALLMAGAMAEILKMMTGDARFSWASRFCVVFGTVAAVGAATLGWFFGGFNLVDGRWLMTTHRWLGTATAVMAIGLLWLCLLDARKEPGESRRLYLVLLFLAAGLVSVVGFLGGSLVYGLDHLAW